MKNNRPPKPRNTALAAAILGRKGGIFTTAESHFREDKKPLISDEHKRPHDSRINQILLEEGEHDSSITKSFQDSPTSFNTPRLKDLSMITYPSLVRAGESKNFVAEVFQKIDGQNFRIEYSKKRGFYKFGSKNVLVDETDLIIGKAVSLFKENYDSLLLSQFKKLNIEGGVIFAEYHGPNSLGGIHDPNDEMELTFFDFTERGGMLAPKLFRKWFEGKIPTPKYLGSFNWTPGFIKTVYDGRFGENEGVVGKSSGVDPYLAKAKTKWWLDKLTERYGKEFKDKFADE